MSLKASGAPEKALSIAILAMGGQGGGVLADWIVNVAEASGWYAQSTSVPGVAQRTGATLYYIEMLPSRDGKPPVLALMPTPGDVDVIIAAELMEAGRSILRGLATPDRTVLITSTHRAYAVSEKEAPGNAIGDPVPVGEAVAFAARQVIAFDMEAVAREAGTVISAPLLGALAATNALPFQRSSFEAVIAASGKGVAASLIGFSEGFSRAASNIPTDLSDSHPQALPRIPATLGRADLDQLLLRLKGIPSHVQDIAFAGLKRVIDFQDVAYGSEYLDRLNVLIEKDRSAGGESHHFAFSAAAAKYLATAMAYDDVIGVADLKTRSGRFARIARDMNASAYEPIYFTEFMHPRAEELVGLLPARMGGRVAASEAWMGRLDRWFNRGRHIETAKLSGFLQLYAVSSLRRFRRKLYRHDGEVKHLEKWLSSATHHLPHNYELATGIIRARRLVKGYSDTHARGLSKFDRVLSAVPMLETRKDAEAWMDRLIAAALKDEDGGALDGALQTLKSL